MIPGIQEINQKMAKILTAADPVIKALKINKSLGELDLNDFAAIKSGQFLRRMTTNASGNAYSTVSPLLKLHDSFTGGHALKDIGMLLDNSTVLNDIYGDPLANSAGNTVARGAMEA